MPKAQQFRVFPRTQVEFDYYCRILPVQFLCLTKEQETKELNKMRSWLRRSKKKGFIRPSVVIRRKSGVIRITDSTLASEVKEPSKPKDTRNLKERIEALGAKRIK